MALRGTTFDVKWETQRVYSVAEKMFAVRGAIGGRDSNFGFKASDLASEMLIEQGLARPAPDMGRNKWVQLLDGDALTDEDIAAYLREAHALVAAKLTKKARAALGIGYRRTAPVRRWSMKAANGLPRSSFPLSRLTLAPLFLCIGHRSRNGEFAPPARPSTGGSGFL